MGEGKTSILGGKRDILVLSIIIATAFMALADSCGRQEAKSALAFLEAVEGRKVQGGRNKPQSCQDLAAGITY